MLCVAGAELVRDALDCWLDQLEMSWLRQGAQHHIRLLTASLFGVGSGREASDDPSEKAIRLATLYRWGVVGHPGVR